MTTGLASCHARTDFELRERAAAERLHRRFSEAEGVGELGSVLFVGEMRNKPVGPHPKRQFEVHFLADSLPGVTSLVEASGLTAFVHPLTDDDLADHTTLARWIGEPVPLDHSVLDPPGRNQGVARFGKSDF